MSANTSIEWTDRTWNPVRGCSIVSPGCVNCYAMKQAHRFSGEGKPYHGLTKQTKAGPQWTGVVRTIEDALLEPLSWRKPARVFVNSMSDLFHEDVPDTFIDRVFAVMALAPQHTFQILTKRAERMHSYFEGFLDSAGTMNEARFERLCGAACEVTASPCAGIAIEDGTWPLSNVWLGVSCENQEQADKRIPLLLQTPAAVRWISAEPLLGSLDVRSYVTAAQIFHFALDVDGALANKSFDGLTENGRTLTRKETEDRLKMLRFQGIKRIPASDQCDGFSQQTGCPGHKRPALDWVVVGGESGPGARPFDLAWARSIVEQCKAANVPVFVKQLGAWPYYGWPHGELPPLQLTRGRNGKAFKISPFLNLDDRKGGAIDEWPEELRVREWPSVAVPA